MSRNCRFGTYCCVDWVKFCIPALTASTALALCLILIVDCRSSIYVSTEWLGLFSHASSGADSCISYARSDYSRSEPPKDAQFRTAQVASLVVMVLGLPLWLVLVLSPFWKRLNGVWPKIISIVVSLIVGNVQLLSVVKFVRFVLDAYDSEEKVHYHRKGVVFCSVFFWFLTAIAISLCGVKQISTHPTTLARNRPAANRVKERDPRKQYTSASEEATKNAQGSKQKPTNGEFKTAFEDTQTTKDLEEGRNAFYKSASEDTKDTKDSEEA